MDRVATAAAHLFAAYDRDGLCEAFCMQDRERVSGILKEVKQKLNSKAIPEIERKFLAITMISDIYFCCGKAPACCCQISEESFSDESMMFALRGLVFRTEGDTIFDQVEQLFLDMMGEEGDKNAISENVKQVSLRRAISCMHQEYANPALKMSDVAQRAFISVSYMTMMLKRETGFTFSEMLTQIRLEHAKELLATTDHKSYEVAAMCGFANASYFSAVFRSTYGMTPTEYRIKSSKQEVSE